MHEREKRKIKIADLRTQIAYLKTQIADLRTQIADLRTQIASVNKPLKSENPIFILRKLRFWEMALPRLNADNMVGLQ